MVPPPPSFGLCVCSRYILTRSLSAESQNFFPWFLAPTCSWVGSHPHFIHPSPLPSLVPRTLCRFMFLRKSWWHTTSNRSAMSDSTAVGLPLPFFEIFPRLSHISGTVCRLSHWKKSCNGLSTPTRFVQKETGRRLENRGTNI